MHPQGNWPKWTVCSLTERCLIAQIKGDKQRMEADRTVCENKSLNRIVSSQISGEKIINTRIRYARWVKHSIDQIDLLKQPTEA